MSEIPLSFKTFDSTANKASDQEAGRSRAIWDSRSSLFGRTRGRLPEVSLCCVPSFSVQFGAISINNTLFLYFAQQSRKYWHWRKSLLPWKKSIESPEHLISLLKNTLFWPQTGLTCCWTWRSDIHHPEFTISDISSWRYKDEWTIPFSPSSENWGDPPSNCLLLGCEQQRLLDSVFLSRRLLDLLLLSLLDYSQGQEMCRAVCKSNRPWADFDWFERRKQRGSPG